MFTSRIGLNGLIGFVRRTSTLSLSAGIQKSHFFTTSQSLNIKSKEKFLLPQKCDIFESNLLKHGLYSRTFSTKVTRVKEKFLKGFVKEPWTLVVGRPHGWYLHLLIAKTKFYYKIACAFILPWVAYNYYFTGYFGSTIFAATYCAFLIVVPLSFFFSLSFFHKITYILMEKSGKNILIGYFSTFFKRKEMIIPLNDILFEKITIKNEWNIQFLILSKKSK